MAAVNPYLDMLSLQQILGLKPGVKAGLENTILVSLDCEAFEFKPSAITEVGVSVLDTRALKDLAPGDDAAAWLPKIETTHYLIEEHAKYKNKRYVKGCPENFSFGTTQSIGKANARYILQRVFADPINLSTAYKSDQKSSDTAPQIILVGHALGNDDDFLKHLKFSLRHITTIVRRADTQRLVRGTGAGKQVGLAKLLKALDIEAKYLHNAGNDAAYTLQALLLMAVYEHEHPGNVASRLGAQAPSQAPSQASASSKRQQKRAKKALQRQQAAQEKAAMVAADTPHTIQNTGAKINIRKRSEPSAS